MSMRILVAAISATLVFAPAASYAQATKPATTAAKPAPATKAAAAAEEDEPSSGEQKKACDAKWKTEKEKTGAKGWKAYFTFMAKCM